MKIGIDISQIAYQNTGVAHYLGSLIENLLKIDKENEYVLFFASLRRNLKNQKSLRPELRARAKIKNTNQKLKIKTFRLPPVFLDILWNKLHIVPIEWLIGDVDLFISSDWTQPPTKKAKKATILYDLIVHKYPNETDSKIVETQKRRLNWVKKECDIVFCISEATKKDAIDLLEIEEKRLHVLYPGV